MMPQNLKRAQGFLRIAPTISSKLFLLFFLFCSSVNSKLEAISKGNNQNTDLITNCPSDCSCTFDGFDHSVQCMEKSLNSKQIENIMKNLSHCKNHFSLELGLNNITRLERRTFQGPASKQIKELWLESSQIKEIDPSAFHYLSELNKIGLQNNKLKEIPSRVFARGEEIEAIWLDGNLIESFSNDTFYGLLNLLTLNLDGNKLTEIPVESLKQTPKLVYFSAAYNMIKEIPNNAFKHVPKLATLNLEFNQILNIGKNAFDGLPFIKVLDLNNNNLENFPQALMNIKQLSALSLKNNYIQSLPDRAFLKQKEIKALELGGNPIKLVGQWTFTDLEKIKILKLPELLEQKIFPDFTNCRGLRNLTITGGKIQRLPYLLCEKLGSLEELYVHENRLKSLNGIEQCRKLKVLKASNNLLQSLSPHIFENLTSLRHLDLSGNYITDLHEMIFRRNSLTTLNLAYNLVSALPTLGMQTLRHLNLTGLPLLLHIPSQSLQMLNRLDATYYYHCCPFINKKEKEISKYKTTYNFHLQQSTDFVCYPYANELTPCVDLLPSSYLRNTLWLFGSFIIFIDMIIFIMKLSHPFIQQKMNKKSNIENVEEEVMKTNKPDSTFDAIFCHLLFADAITCLYFVVILAYDNQTKGNFAAEGARWERSFLCTTIGFVLVAGIQLSLFTLTLVAFERYLVLKHPNNPQKHLSRNVIALIIGASWTNAIATAIVTMYSDGLSQVRSANIEHLLPSTNGATCLPWALKFPFSIALTIAFLVTSGMAVVICFRLLCPNKESDKENGHRETRRQLVLMIVLNLLLLAPLAAYALLASTIITYPSFAGEWIEYDDDGGLKSLLNVSFLLNSSLLLIALKLIVNLLLYIIFNRTLRSDFCFVLNTIYDTVCKCQFVKRDLKEKNETDLMGNEFTFHNVSETNCYDSAQHVRTKTTKECDSFTDENSSYDLMNKSICCGMDSDISSSAFVIDPFSSHRCARSLSITGDEDSLDEVHRHACDLCSDGDADIESIGESSGPESVSHARRSQICYNRKSTCIAVHIQPDKTPEAPNSSQQEVKVIESGNGKFSHSSDSSASKDSGIQSEPDYFCSQQLEARSWNQNHHHRSAEFSSTLSSNQNSRSIYPAIDRRRYVTNATQTLSKGEIV